MLKAGDERLTEAFEAVAVGEHCGVLDAIEMAADLFGGVNAVVQIGDEAGDGALEVNIVLPERVVGVDEQGLVGGATSGRERAAVRDRVWGVH